MENFSIGFAGVVGSEEDDNSSRKSKSLDLQSFYKSRDAKEGTNNNKGKSKLAADENEEVRKEKKRRKTNGTGKAGKAEEPEGEKSRKIHGDVENVNGAVRSESVDSDNKLVPSLSEMLNSSNALIGISLSFDQNGHVFRIPKRRRGSVGRKRFNGEFAPKELEGKSGTVHQVARVNGEVENVEAQCVANIPDSSEAGPSDQAAETVPSSSACDVAKQKVKCEAGSPECKESRDGSSSSAQHVTAEDGPSIVNNGNASKKRRPNHRKRKGYSSISQTAAKEVETPVGDSGSMCVYLPEDDDEENLEQNAARMLSSRFDPSCTVFSSKTRSFSSIISSEQDLADRDVNSLAGSESPSVDNSSRVLRPRKQHSENGSSRKRRHYYEVLPRDLDGYWVLNRRIKVFWPLDNSWYYGLINDYDPEKELHHIKYDDRDEEWIKLGSEKFKLLLLRDEVPRKAGLKRSSRVRAADKGKMKSKSRINNDVPVGNSLDSEPIITWLARSSRRVKPSPSSPMKKQKVSGPPTMKLYDELEAESNGHGEEEGGGEALPSSLGDGGRSKSFFLESFKPPVAKKSIVYYRRRFRDKVLNSSYGADNQCGSPPGTLTSLVPEGCNMCSWKEYGSGVLGCPGNEKLLWLLDDDGALRLSMPLIESEGYRLQTCLSPLPLHGKLYGREHIWLFHTLLPSQYGAMISRWPMVILEILLVDNNVGMRTLLFEGSLDHAAGFLFLILSVFNQRAEERLLVDLQLPVTSLRIRLSSVGDPSKQQVFAFYSFLKLKRSKWLYLDSELQRQCSLTQQLPVSECTYDNIKAFEDGSYQLDAPSTGLEQLDLRKKSLHNVMPISCSSKMGRSDIRFAVTHRKLPPFALSFTAAPTFFLSMHLKMLMKRNFSRITLGDVGSQVDPDPNSLSITQEIINIESVAKKDVKVLSVSDVGSSSGGDASSKCLTAVQPQPEKVAIPGGDVGDCIVSPQHFQMGKVDVSTSSPCFLELQNNSTGGAVEFQNFADQQVKAVETLQPSVPEISASPSGFSSVGGVSVKISSFDQVNRSLHERAHLCGQPSDLTLRTANVQSPNHTGFRSSWKRNRTSSSSPLGDLSPVWHDGKTNMIKGVFSNGPKKPRTQVQYSMPYGGYDLSSKHKSHQRSLPYKRIRRADDRRISDGSRCSHRNLELSACDANVLVTLGDKGWRDCGARVVLALADHNEWRLAVHLNGVTKYTHKVNNLLQWSTNRYTHAMMWKGGKDWVLEFPDRSQWLLFKEMHEECHNRNIRAASVKNIPIPGVRLIEEFDECGTNSPFFRHSAKYFRQLENDVEMAMNPSRVLYDMDSEDEQWLLENKRAPCTDNGICCEISDELFEKTMDMFEKVAYAQQCDRLTSDEVETLAVKVESTEVAKLIYEHWLQKRQRKGMSLIRHLQPPLWEQYQQQVKEWEQAVAQANSALSSVCQERPVAKEKPPMFAFCLRPRGMEVPNKGSKHRSHKKFSVAIHNHTVSGDQDGRRLNVEERTFFPGNGVDSSEASPLLQASVRGYSPRDASVLGCFSLGNDVSEWNQNQRLHRTRAKKFVGGFPSGNPPMGASYNQRMIGKRNGVHQWTMDVAEWSNHKYHQSEGTYRHNIQQFDSSDVQEFRLRDASGAAHHAQNMAKLKRERAQRLLYRADLAIHKAVVAIMTAEAMKDASGSSNGDI